MCVKTWPSPKNLISVLFEGCQSMYVPVFHGVLTQAYNPVYLICLLIYRVLLPIICHFAVQYFVLFRPVVAHWFVSNNGLCD